MNLRNVYRGFRDANGVAVVAVNDGSGLLKPLPHRARHSPDGFEWGYEGSGPADLARSLLADVYGHVPAPHVCQLFKRNVIAGLSRGAEWTLTATEIEAAMHVLTRGEGITCVVCGDAGYFAEEEPERPEWAVQPCQCRKGAGLREQLRREHAPMHG